TFALEPWLLTVNARLDFLRRTTPIKKEFDHGDLDSVPHRRPLGPCLLSGKPGAMDRGSLDPAGARRAHDRHLPAPGMAAIPGRSRCAQLHPTAPEPDH